MQVFGVEPFAVALYRGGHNQGVVKAELVPFRVAEGLLDGGWCVDVNTPVEVDLRFSEGVCTRCPVNGQLPSQYVAKLL
jgi:hypothetical protein